MTYSSALLKCAIIVLVSSPVTVVAPIAIAISQNDPILPKTEHGYVWHSAPPPVAYTPAPAPASRPTRTMMADASSEVAVNLRLCPIPADSNDAPLTDISCRRPIGGPR